MHSKHVLLRRPIVKRASSKIKKINKQILFKPCFSPSQWFWWWRCLQLDQHLAQWHCTRLRWWASHGRLSCWPQRAHWSRWGRHCWLWNQSHLTLGLPFLKMGVCEAANANHTQPGSKMYCLFSSTQKLRIWEVKPRLLGPLKVMAKHCVSLAATQC